jgi:hypothetical protein
LVLKRARATILAESVYAHAFFPHRSPKSAPKTTLLKRAGGSLTLINGGPDLFGLMGISSVSLSLLSPQSVHVLSFGGVFMDQSYPLALP